MKGKQMKLICPVWIVVSDMFLCVLGFLFAVLLVYCSSRPYPISVTPAIQWCISGSGCLSAVLEIIGLITLRVGIAAIPDDR
jgi:hypothetical protein